jgi:hypothetical protein
MKGMLPAIMFAAAVLASDPAAWGSDADTAVDAPAKVVAGNAGPSASSAVTDTASSNAAITGRTGGKTSRMTAKPTAPIDIRWLSTGEDGIVSLEIVSGVDHVGASVRVIAPGIGRPLAMQLPAADAGEVQSAEWTINRPVRGPTRAIVEIDTGEQTMAGTAVVPGELRKPDRQSAVRARSDVDSSQKVTTDALIELPAEQTIRRKGD